MDARANEGIGGAEPAECCARKEVALSARLKHELTSSDILELFDERIAIMLESGVDQARAIRTAYAQVRQAYGDIKLPDEIIQKVSECL